MFPVVRGQDKAWEGYGDLCKWSEVSPQMLDVLGYNRSRKQICRHCGATTRVSRFTCAFKYLRFYMFRLHVQVKVDRSDIQNRGRRG